MSTCSRSRRRPAWLFLAMLLLASSVIRADDRRSIESKLQDRDGQPIPDARVFALDATSEWETTTDGDGQFRLDDLAVDGTFLFVEADGFRFHGQHLTTEEVRTPITLHRDSDPPEAMLEYQAWTISKEKRQQLFRQVFEPFFNEILKNESDTYRGQTLQLYAKVDPEDAIKLTQDGTIADKDVQLQIRMKAIESIARKDSDRALELLDDFEFKPFAAQAILSLLQHATGLNEMQKLALANRAAKRVREQKDGAMKVVAAGLIGEVYLELGETDKGTELLKEALPVAEKLGNGSWTGYCKGAFAEEFAQIDPEKGIELARGLTDDYERSRHLGNIAHELAYIDPDKAEEALNLIKRSPQSRSVIQERDQYVIRVCYRLATVDLDRARRIADSCIQIDLAAYSHGLIAAALAESEPEEARQSLLHAYDLLRKGSRDPNEIEIHASQIAGALLPVAEKVDPSLLRELTWRAISLRTPRAGGPRNNWSDQFTAHLANWISFYDRDSAKVIMAKWHSTDEQQFGGYQTTVMLTYLDPELGVQFCEGQDEGGTPGPCRYYVAEALSLDDRERLTKAHAGPGLWQPDKED